jgi:nucleotide-binding universal stress UspA family protein
MNDLKTFLVPLDGSPLSEKAIPLAVSLAKKFNSLIILTRALDFLHPTVLAPHLTTATAHALTEAHKQLYQEARQYLEAQQKELEKQDLRVQVLLLDTSPAEGILEAAIHHHVDMIIMSTHGRGGISRWALGSIADKVARHAPCPVLLVRYNNE